MSYFTKRNFLFLSVIILAVLAGVLVKTIFSKQHPIPELRLAIVDGSRIKSESKAFLKIEEMANRELNQLNAKLSNTYKDLQMLLKKSKDTKNSIKVRAEYKRQFDEKYTEFEQQAQQIKENFKNKYSVMRETVSNYAIQATRDLAKKYNLNIILNTQAFDLMTVFYASKNVDLTDEAIQIIDSKFKY